MLKKYSSRVEPNRLTKPTSSLASAARITKQPYRMIQQPTLLPRILILALSLIFTLPAGAAEKSLYDKKAAQKIDVSKLSILGPKAGKFRYDKRLLRAAEIAAERARAHSHGVCWRAVKDAMVSAGIVESRPDTGYAKQAAEELTTEYGFRKIRCVDPYKAPLASVLVYGGRGAGHVEFRTKYGFVSDFVSIRPSKRPLIGVYVK